MKKITILTLFPEMFVGLLTNSIIKRALAKKVCEINIVNIRDFTLDKHHRVDNPPIGGGAGLIMKCQPIIDALNSVKDENSHSILLSPLGKTYNQKRARELALDHKDIILICGHYEGVDTRVNEYVDELISIGDYILTGGEIPSMSIVDSIIRLLDGAINEQSIVDESFENGLLEYPQYSEPYSYDDKKVPDILYCGNHEIIRKYRRKESLKLTLKHRPDLLEKISLTKEDKELLEEIKKGIDEPEWYQKALQKGSKFLKN